MKKTTLLLILLLAFGTLMAQNRRPRKIRDIKAVDTLLIKNQYQFLIDNSDSYQEYKVIKLEWLRVVGNHLNDSLNNLNNRLYTNIEQVQKLESDKAALHNQISTLENEVKEKDTIRFLGIKMKKGSYHIFVWVLIFGLIGILSYYIYRFKEAHKITSETLEKYDELEDEFNQSRSRALEREQALNRKLMDAQKKSSE